MIFAKNFEQTTKTDIDDLVSNQVAEGREVDYKERLPGRTLEEKREYLYDLTSFANTSGGVIIFGIQEQRDANNNPTGLPGNAFGLAGINADKEIQRLESFQLTGVERRVPGVRIKAIDGFASGPVLVIFIPKSWAAPHMVTLGGIHRFYLRNERGKNLMSWHEIESAFLLSEALAEKVRTFRYERLAKVTVGEELPVALQGTARLVLHLVPTSAMERSSDVDILIGKTDPKTLAPPGWRYSSSWGQSLNLDGLAKTLGQISYAQLFRNGSIEAVDTHLLNFKLGQIPWPTLEQEVIEQCQQHLGLLQRLETRPPIIIMLSLLGVKGARIVSEGRMQFFPTEQLDRAQVILPDVLAEHFNTDVPHLLRPIFDTLWQGCGRDHSPSYDARGNYLQGPKR